MEPVRSKQDVTSSQWQSICHLLRECANRDTDRELLRFEGRSASCGDVEIESNRLANVLEAHGVRPGDRVGIMLPNGLEFPTTGLGIAKARGMAVPINVQYRRRDLTHVLQDSGARLVITNHESISLLNEIRSHCPQLETVAVLSNTCEADNVVTLGDEVRDSLPHRGIDDIKLQDVVTIQYTSGTTGFPKGCLLTHEYWINLAIVFQHYAQLRATDCMLTAQAFSYMDPTWQFLICMMTGAPLVIVPRFSPSTFWQTIKDNDVTVFYCIGTMPMYLWKQPVNPSVERGHAVRLVFCSGIPAHLHRDFVERWDCAWREAYGTTELGVVLAVPADDAESVGSGAMGAPVPHREVKVVAEDGTEVAEGQAGELLVRGPATMVGYHNNAEATRKWMRDGWVHTGDVVFRDQRGYYHHVGRTKDMIRRAGENIAASEVEAVLCEHTKVLAAACIPVPDEVRGEEVKAFVQLRPDETANSLPPEELIAFAGERLAAFKIPRYIEYVNSFPLTQSDKIAKSRLIDRERDQRIGAYDARSGEWG